MVKKKESYSVLYVDDEKGFLELAKDFSGVIKDAEVRKYVEGMNENAIWFYCNKCNYTVYIKPNSERHKEIINYISKNKRHWTHENCETHDM